MATVTFLEIYFLLIFNYFHNPKPFHPLTTFSTMLFRQSRTAHPQAKEEQVGTADLGCPAGRSPATAGSNPDPAPDP